MGSLHKDKHEAILNAGYDLFGTHGFYETKMSDIAELAGIAKGLSQAFYGEVHPNRCRNPGDGLP
ncbi:TetR/AcrR family transcriptional regulator [Paenibacillus dendrobii]|uniref:TetR/AcrR family transcriptional regulator n=1 Tax=Paenibacillus dendrobii TaxID=2691084 RepID=UPI00311A9681